MNVCIKNLYLIIIKTRFLYNNTFCESGLKSQLILSMMDAMSRSHGWLSLIRFSHFVSNFDFKIVIDEELVG